MTASKEIFLRNRELAKWWASITHDNRFTEVATFARAEIMEQRPTQDQMVGAELLIHTLSTLPEGEANPFEFPTPGLHHQSDKPPVRPKKE